MIDESKVISLLNNFHDPYLQKKWGEAKINTQCKINEKSIIIDSTLGYPFVTKTTQIIANLQNYLQSYFCDYGIQINLHSKIANHSIQQPNIKISSEIKNVIAVGSGKGGVGKSTTAVNLAIALKNLGARVGILDADIYGPNVPHLLGVKNVPDVRTTKGFTPLERFDIQSISIGYLVDANAPMIWRGPMISQALQQLYNETLWDNLDYLILDMPLGTGDIPLTMAQKIPIAGAVIITTPQEMASADARKALEMLRKLNINILGIIENMSLHTCSQCGHAESIFGLGGAQKIAHETNTELLGVLPLDQTIATQAERGEHNASIYEDIALRIAAKLSLQPKNYSGKIPPVVTV